MPVVTMSWLNDDTPPRSRGGACSEMYSTDTNDAVPTASPSTKRLPNSNSVVGANADPRPPST